MRASGKRQVKTEDAQLDRMYRMPVVFGPAPGPRNVPKDKQRYRYVNRRVALTVYATTDEEALTPYLPPRCRLAADPLISVNVSSLTNLGWLAGRGYNIVTVQFHNIAFDGDEGTIIGDFSAVLWESLADPIITGREEIAVPKIYADIPDHKIVGDRYEASASWEGFRFFDMVVEGLAEAPAGETKRLPLLVYKYMPRTGEWGQADAAYMTASGPDINEAPVIIHEHRVGKGSFAFHPARWEDLPTQYMIVNALAALPLWEFSHATLRVTSQGEVESVGGGNICGQHEIR
jgi:hypothetical protein